ncbi:MAG: HEAT repeat domain-containing protein [Planctomycetes bacterium]|nr:HEAT repeat domain-containing protein [Planctomycetota bacterium]
MTPRPPAPVVLVLALLAGALPACKGGPRAADRERARSGSATDPGGDADPASFDPAESGTGRPLAPAQQERFVRIESLVAQWDAVQQEGKDEEASLLAKKVGEETDADFDVIVASARGQHGVRAEHLAVKALGFSTRREATAVLVSKLTSPDAALVGNALIAIKLRADPDTPLPPIVALLRSNTLEARRFAPLAFANVVIARERAGRPIEEAIAEKAMTGLVGLVQDRDPYARLHTAKAMGALRRPEATDFLVLLLKDEHTRIRLAAAAALERIGDPRTFPQVLRLFDDLPEEQKPVLRDILASYAAHLTGSPIPPDEVLRLGTSPIAWDRWYADHVAGAKR